MFTGRRNVLLLAISQALMLSVVVMAMALGAILGGGLAPDKGYATLPIAVMVIGTAIASMPAAILMRRFGRRTGFLTGAALGLAGSLLCAFALQQRSFALFVSGHLLLGSYQGFANYYRFAAAEATEASHTSRAIAWVIAGGVVAAFLGPQLGQWGRDWVSDGLFVGSYLAQGALSLVSLAILSQLRLKPVAVAHSVAARPLPEILSQPVLQLAILGAAIGYAVMIMVMTATPLAILGCGLPGASVTPVIQWHVVGMFAPSFFTGSLIRRYGAPQVMQIGFVLLLGHVVITLLGIEFLHFLSALILLGVGWNFAFIGGTTLLTQTYRPSEQFKIQAINEFTIFGLAAVATLSAGWLYDRFGWITLNLTVVPLLAIALLATLPLARRLQLPEKPA
ncbi:MAG: MFS transporter [Gallionella sp.]|nr:MFS transporter [Gallionella sp.]